MQPQVPIVNAGVLYVNGMITGTSDGSPLITVGPGAARDSTNTVDIVFNSTVTIDGRKVGAGGCDVNPRVVNELYAIYAIADSSGYNPPSAVLSVASNLNLVLPKGYDVSRRIGWAASNGSLPGSPEAGFLKWYHFGSGQNRTYIYDVGIPVVIGDSADVYKLVPNPVDTPASSLKTCVPYINTEVFLSILYTTANPGDYLNFAPPGSPNAGFGNPSPIKFGGGPAGTQEGNAYVPCLFEAGSPKFLYKSQASSSTTLAVYGFYDVL